MGPLREQGWTAVGWLVGYHGAPVGVGSDEFAKLDRVVVLGRGSVALPREAAGVDRVEAPLEQRLLVAQTCARVEAHGAERAGVLERRRRALLDALLVVGDPRGVPKGRPKVREGVREGELVEEPPVVGGALQPRDPKAVAHELLHREDVGVLGAVDLVEVVQELERLRERVAG